MKKHPEDKQSNESDWLLGDDLSLLREHSFKKTLQVSRLRRIKYQTLKLLPVFLLFFGWMVYDSEWLIKSKDNQKIAKTSVKVQPHASFVRVPEKAPKIRILTDKEFEEMIEGYPLAIIHEGGQNHYLPLER